MRCEQEIAVGAYLLDALEPDEQVRMRAHIDQCPVCTESVSELEGVSRLLAGVQVTGLDLAEDVQQTPRPSEFAYQRLRSAATRPEVTTAAPTTASGATVTPIQPPRRRSWRALAVAAAAVAVLGAAGVGGAIALSASSPTPTTVTATAGAMSARATIAPEGSGSRIVLTLDGVPAGQRCQLVAVGRDGRRQGTHWWTVTNYDRDWADTVGVAPGDIDHLEVVTRDGRTLFTLHA